MKIEEVHNRFNTKKFQRTVYYHKDNCNTVIKTITEHVPNDISSNNQGDALNWLVSCYMQYGISCLLPSTHKDVEEFFQIKQQNLGKLLKIQALSKIQHPRELHNIVNEAQPAYNRHIQNKNSKCKTNVSKDYRFTEEDWDFYECLSKGTAIELGKNTTWCTRSPGLNYYEQYSKEGPLIIAINSKKPSEKYQLHFPTGQFQCAQDQEMPTELFIKFYVMISNNKDKFQKDIGDKNYSIAIVDAIPDDILNDLQDNNT